MSFLIPALRKTGPVAPYEYASVKFKLPILTKRDFQIRFVVKTEKISVNDLKQSRAKRVTSKKNW
jgi:hypothetical protein